MCTFRRRRKKSDGVERLKVKQLNFRVQKSYFFPSAAPSRPLRLSG